jgi:hypothetical protein
LLNRCFFWTSFQVYTAKSLSVGKSGETFDDVQLQSLSDVVNETIVTEIKTNPPPRISSLFNFNKLNRLKLDIESLEDDMNNEIEKGDVIEIEVPVIGSDFARMRKYRESSELEVNEDVEINAKGYAEIDILTTSTTTTSDLLQTEAESDDTLTFLPDFQASPSDETGFKNDLETASQTEFEISSTTTKSAESATKSKTFDESDIQSVESKLMEQWKVPDTDIIDDDSFESEMYTIRTQRPKFPFNVKIVVNNDDERKSCKSKSSCQQVSFTRSKLRDIDPQYYSDYSDEDLSFQAANVRYSEKQNELRTRNARRAADDLGFLTPAPRFQPFQPIKKPGFIERLENESSLERSERLNKGLDDFMKFISIWAQVDRFVSDRARSTVQRLVHVTGDDYGDDFVGSRHRSSRKESAKRTIDEPFT